MIVCYRLFVCRWIWIWVWKLDIPSCHWRVHNSRYSVMRSRLICEAAISLAEMDMVENQVCLKNHLWSWLCLVYGETFPDENFELNHTRPGLLSMVKLLENESKNKANAGKDTQVFKLCRAPLNDIGKSVCYHDESSPLAWWKTCCTSFLSLKHWWWQVFGEVLSGYEVVQKIERTKTDSG